MARKIINYSLIMLIAAIFIVGGYAYWLHQKIYPNTDDATVAAHVVNIAAQVSGKIQTVLAQNQTHVTQNQLLFTM